MRNISFKQYRIIDLATLSALLVLSEGLTTTVTNKWFVGVAFAISTTLLFVCIGMMRWGAYGAVLAIVGGITFLVSSEADAKRWVIYIIGNLFSLLALLFIKALGKTKIRKSIWLLVLYSCVTYLSMCIGRWLVSLVFEPSIKSLIAFIGTDVITLLFTSVVLALMRNVDGMIEDQREYVIRQAQDREAEQKNDAQKLEDIIADPNYLDDVLGDDEDI